MSDARPEVSVIMAAYNSRRYLEAAIKSVQDQTLRSWELVIVDDASSDGSAALADDMSRCDARIKVIRLKANLGPAAARNAAIDATRGHWLAMFDSDDLMSPLRLKTLLGRAEGDRAVIVADNQLLFSDAGKKRMLLGRRYAKPRSIGFAEFVDSNRLYSRSPDLGYLKPLIHAPTLKHLGARYDEGLRIGEDYEFMARLLASGLTIRIEPEPLYLYRKHAQSVSYRMGAKDIIALINVEDRLANSVVRPTREEALALLRRRQSLESMLKYDQVVSSIKAGEYERAVQIIVGAPPIWPLLSRPLRARAGRLLASLGGSGRGESVP